MSMLPLAFSLRFVLGRTLSLSVALSLVTTACALGNGSAHLASPTTAPTAQTHPHVMVIMEENRSPSDVVANKHMPYTNWLASQYGLATNWTAVWHPSLPNYLALISGSTHDVIDDLSYHSFDGDNLGSQLSTAGISWKAFMQDMPAPCSNVDSVGKYAKKHNPFAFFTRITKSPDCADHVVPTTEFDVNNLPDFVWYTPDMCADGHDCNDEVVDSALQALVPKVLASAWYAQGGTIIITWDEGNWYDFEGGGGHIPTIVLHGKGTGIKETTRGDHYGTLQTIEDLYGLPRLGEARKAKTSLMSLISGQ